jgi:hypothetical protein
MRLPSILVLALLALGAPIPSPTEAAQVQSNGVCSADSYVNSRRNCVHRPVRANRAPEGATAHCRDGTYSFSQSRRGTCSRHGGVAQWLRG